MTDQPALSPQPRRTGWRNLIALTLVVLVGGAIGLVYWRVAGDPDAAVETPSATVETTPTVVDSRGQLVIPEVDLAVPLGTMQVVDGVIDPPGVASAYLITNHGVTPAEATAGTVFVALHALADGTGPGNKLADPATQTTALQVGDEIGLDGVTYRVTSVTARLKDDLTRDTALWEPTEPGRLVIVTCLATAGGDAWNNLVVEAVHSVGVDG